jgi:hypothetical protein
MAAGMERTPSAPVRVVTADAPSTDQEGMAGEVAWAAALATSIGNRSLSRLLGPGRGGVRSLLREPGATQTPPPAAPAQAPGGQQDPAQQGPQPTLDPEIAKKILYAQTVLKNVGQLPEAEKANLNKMVGGSDLMNVIERRDKTRTDLEQAKTDLESARDISGAEKAPEMKKAQDRIDSLGLDLEGLQLQIGEGLKKIGVASEEELVALVAKFPELWKKRGKEVSGKMLDENAKAVDSETQRYDTSQTPKAQGPTDVAGLRAADQEIGAAVGEILRLQYPTGASGVTVTLDGLQADVDRGPPQPPPQQDDRNQPLGGAYGRAMDAQQARNLAAAHERKIGLLGRWRALGMTHVFLFHP